ncbi:peptidoglycan/xylan/chitin deacetylase (PgdA/CDA1 family) [Rhodoligotrophos appendicifer]|uniref:polysaccharide deacetylase family protein n=1 Tax=Rhodoligotrophos appendicifer TaxID=987056 RepID=UPI00118623FE|nr:polysaccharide deacetylase family protein [Rhodoligotrophos appendicifer]
MLLPAQRRYDFSPIFSRPDYSWPDGKRLAVWIGTGIEVFAFQAGIGHDPFHQGAPQTQRNYAWRDYGYRVGLWRLLELYEQLGLPVTAAVNSLAYDYYPEVFAELRKRGAAIVAHGRTNAERQTQMWEDDERRVIDGVTQTIAQHEGQRPKGWLGVGVLESSHTADLLQELGYSYVLDWPMDDQPVWLRTRKGRILSIPGPMEVNDSAQILHRHANPTEFADMVVDQFDELLRQSDAQPLVFNLMLHPFVSGQPFRLPSLRRALQHIAGHAAKERIWFTDPDRIADHCMMLPSGTVPGDQ